MKILFIEADKWLDDHQEVFQNKLTDNGHSVLTICDVYNKPMMLKSALLNMRPDAIFIQTTFVYGDKIKSLVPMVKFIDYPVEIWYAGNYSATRIIDLLPIEKQSLFTGFDIWMDVYGEPDMINHWKKKSYPLAV